MEATADIKTHPQQSLLQQFMDFWHTLPDKAAFGVLLAAWLLIFQYFGWMTVILGRSPSLFGWLSWKWSDPFFDAEHGKLIPWVVLALLWFRRDRLIKAVRGAWWPALFIVGAALAIHCLAYLLQQPRLSVVALFFGAWGLVGLVWGLEMLKATLFPFFVFAFCVPMGGTFAQGFSLPLRLSAAKTTAFIANHFMDISVAREGTALRDPAGRSGNYDVAAACSGIRSLLALLAISTILAALTVRKFWKRAVLIAMCVPLAYACNVLRLSTIILMAKSFDSKRAGDLTDKYFGFVTYAIALICVLLVARWLKEKPSASLLETSSPLPSPPQACGGEGEDKGLKSGARRSSPLPISGGEGDDAGVSRS